MYTIEAAEQVTLFFVVAYYAGHFRHRLHAAWNRVRHQLNEMKQQHFTKRAAAVILFLFVLQGCVEASPVIFYSLHIGAGFLD